MSFTNCLSSEFTFMSPPSKPQNKRAERSISSLCPYTKPKDNLGLKVSLLGHCELSAPGKGSGYFKLSDVNHDTSHLPPPLFILLFFSWKLWQRIEAFPCPLFYSEKIYRHVSLRKGVISLPNVVLLSCWTAAILPAQGRSSDLFSLKTRLSQGRYG